MKKIFFLLLLMPLMVSAQTTKQKVLYMKAVRTNGSTNARLESTEGFLGPIYNPETRRYFINGVFRTQNTIKEIRFEIKEEDVPDGIERVDGHAGEAPAQAYDLGGRRVDENRIARGIYIKGGKKVVK